MNLAVLGSISALFTPRFLSAVSTVAAAQWPRATALLLSMGRWLKELEIVSEGQTDPGYKENYLQTSPKQTANTQTTHTHTHTHSRLVMLKKSYK